MKKLMALAIMSLLAFSTFAQSVPFSIGEWSPYTGEKLTNQGAVAELVTAACTAGGLTASFKFYPWARAEKEVTDGVAFATFPYQKVANDSNYNYSDPLVKGVFKVFYSSNNPKIKNGFKFNSLKDLAGLKVAGVAGYAKVIDDLKNANLDIDNTPDIEAAFKKLNANRVDIVIEDQAAGFAVAKMVIPGNTSNIMVFDTPYGDPAGNNYYLKVSKTFKGSADILNKFNQGLMKIQKSGDYAKIVKKYNMVSVQ